MSIVMSVNAGSSSLKFQVFKMPEEEVLAQGNVERIGLSDVYTAAVIAGNNAAVHIELGSVTIHIHAAAIFPGGMRNTAAVPAICQGKHIRGISVYNDNISPHIITI